MGEWEEPLSHTNLDSFGLIRYIDPLSDPDGVVGFTVDCVDNVFGAATVQYGSKINVVSVVFYF